MGGQAKLYRLSCFLFGTKYFPDLTRTLKLMFGRVICSVQLVYMVILQIITSS